MPRIQQLLRKHICQRPILHLSFFDGIGAASFALQYLGANIVFTLSCETNPQCQALLQHHFQSIQHGDVSLLTIILITSGPPCVDFSRLRNLPPGMQGEQGNLLSRPEGPTLWLHHVLLFGSAASVWSYNRFGDVLTSLSRVLTATPVVHFVDDYGSIQPATHAMSGFQAFGHLNSTLGFHMKTSKEQPPQHEHKIQGVYIHTDSTHITIKPCRQRIQQITTTLKQAIDTNSLQPSLAQKLAGKCAFTATQLFGKVGRAANISNHTRSFRQTHQTGDTSYDRHSTTRTATCRSICPNHLPTNHHLHRCILPDWRGTQTLLWPHRGRLTTCTQRPTQWMGYSRILSRQTAHCYQWPCPSELTSPVHILQSLHILPRSLDSRHRTSFIPTTPDPTLYPIVRQRGIKTCHHQGYRQTPTTQQHHWSSLDMAQQMSVTPDTRQST